MQLVRSASEPDLTRVTSAYVATARTLVDAGFDVLELHLAHCYLYLVVPGARPQPPHGRVRRVAGAPRPARSPGGARRARRGRRGGRGHREGVGDRRLQGGVTTDDGVAVALLLEGDGPLDALQLSGGSSLMNPMYLFRGEAPVEEFAATMPRAGPPGHADAGGAGGS